MGRRMHKAICQADRDRINPHTPMPPSVQQAKPQNREKSCRKIQEDPFFQTMNAAPPVQITRPPRVVKSIRTLASLQRHFGQEPV